MDYESKFSPEEAKKIANELLIAADNKPLNETEEKILKGTIFERKTYKEIKIGKKPNSATLKDTGAKLWQRLTKGLKKKGMSAAKVDKFNVEHWLREYWKWKNRDSLRNPIEATPHLKENTNQDNNHVTSAHQVIVVLRGRLTEDNKVEHGVSQEVTRIFDYFKKKYRLKADPIISGTKQYELRITLRGLLEDMKKLRELFRAEKLKDIFHIPVNDIQILNESLDDKNNKHNLVQEIHSQTVEGRQLGSANLSEMDLRHAYLIRANLSDANLSDANLSDANLSDANLLRADLFRANLCETELRQANLCGADLRRANLCGANLGSAKIDHTTKLSDIWYRYWKRINQEAEGKDSSRGANLKNANLEKANLEKANLEKACLKGACLKGARLKGACLKGADLENADLENADLENADLSFANLGSADLIHVNNVNYTRFRFSKGLSEDMRLYLKQQGAIFEFDPARRIVSHVVGMIRDSSRWIVSQEVRNILSFIVIAIVAFTLVYKYGDSIQPLLNKALDSEEFRQILKEFNQIPETWNNIPEEFKGNP